MSWAAVEKRFGSLLIQRINPFNSTHCGGKLAVCIICTVITQLRSCVGQVDVSQGERGSMQTIHSGSWPEKAASPDPGHQPAARTGSQRCTHVRWQSRRERKDSQLSEDAMKRNECRSEREVTQQSTAVRPQAYRSESSERPSTGARKYRWIICCFCCRW